MSEIKHGDDNSIALTDAELADFKFVRAYIASCHDSFAQAMAEIKRLKSVASCSQGMADCMDMVRGELIEAGVINKTVPPMFIANAVCAYIASIQARLISLIDLTPTWVSVKDRLPPSDGFYLVYQDEFPSSLPHMRRFSKKRTFQGRCQYISHWMPLPASPKKEGV